MGLLDRFRNKETAQNGININHTDTLAAPKTFSLFNRHGKLEFGEIFAYAVVTRIFDGLRNVTWKTTDTTNVLANNVIDFIDNNFNILIYHYYRDGYATVIVENNGRIRLPKPNELRKDRNGMISNTDAITVYSDPYVFDRTSHFKLIQPILANININYNNSNFVSEQCGMYGILSGGSIPISPAAKEELQAKLRKDYGMSDDKFNFILSNAEIKFTPITIPAKDLEFNQKVKDSVGYLCNFFKINPMLIFGDSTFNNQSEAVRSFYQNCIQPLAEILLNMARNIYIKMNTSTLQPSTIITYDFANIPEYNTTLSAQCAEKTALLEYLLKLRDAGEDVDIQIARLSREVNELFNV